MRQLHNYSGHKEKNPKEPVSKLFFFTTENSEINERIEGIAYPEYNQRRLFHHKEKNPKETVA